VRGGVTVIQLHLAGAPTTEADPSFLQKMVDSMALSFFKYGPVAEGYPKNVSALDSLMVRLCRYAGLDAVQDALDTASKTCNHRGDGNKRWLVDTANFAMIEAMCPRNPLAHWPEHDEKSPGRVDNAGNISERANNASREALRNPTSAPSWMRRSGD
jgi:hypothetical protein